MQQLVDNEYLLQRHFGAVLEAAKLLQKTQLNELGNCSVHLPPSECSVASESSIQPGAATGSTVLDSLMLNSGLCQASILSVAAQLESVRQAGSAFCDKSVDVDASIFPEEHHDHSPLADEDGGAGLEYLVGELITGEQTMFMPPIIMKKDIEELVDLKISRNNLCWLDGMRLLSADLVEQRFRYVGVFNANE